MSRRAVILALVWVGAFALLLIAWAYLLGLPTPRSGEWPSTASRTAAQATVPGGRITPPSEAPTAPSWVATAPRSSPTAAARLQPTSPPGRDASESGITLREATWYCLSGRSACHYRYPDGPGLDLYAAISPDLAYLNGRRVTVSWRGRSVTVRIIDCDCQAWRSIDLYADAFRQLAPLSVGSLRGATLTR